MNLCSCKIVRHSFENAFIRWVGWPFENEIYAAEKWMILLRWFRWDDFEWFYFVFGHQIIALLHSFVARKSSSIRIVWYPLHLDNVYMMFPSLVGRCHAHDHSAREWKEASERAMKKNASRKTFHFNQGTFVTFKSCVFIPSGYLCCVKHTVHLSIRTGRVPSAGVFESVAKFHRPINRSWCVCVQWQWQRWKCTNKKPKIGFIKKLLLFVSFGFYFF